MITTNSQPLIGRHVRLEPLSLDHLEGLAAALLGANLWQWMPSTVQNTEQLRAWVEDALAEHVRGEAVPFATILCSENRVVGSTRFLALSAPHHRVEIGGTLVGAAWQRTVVNTESKYLMLRHAFEVWQCARVELKTHAANERSRAAIRRLGAVEEGTLRSHMLQPDGSRRDSVYYSILNSEWPTVRARLEARLAS